MIAFFHFINVIIQIMTSLKTKNSSAHIAPEISESTDFLMVQLIIIETACVDHNDEAVYYAIDRLKEMMWNTATVEKLTAIHNAVLMDGDFDKAGALAEELMSSQKITSEKPFGALRR